MDHVKWISALGLGTLASCATAATPTKTSYSRGAVTPPITQAQTSRGDLEPIDELLSDRRQIELRTLLLGDTPSTFWVVCDPSFTPPYAVSITETETARDTFSTEWADVVVEVARADSRLDAKHPSPRVTRRRMVLDAAATNVIADAWGLVVLRARYKPREYALDENGKRVLIGHSMIDGVGFEFQCGSHHAKTRTPDPGFASDLIALIAQLMACVDLPAADQSAAIAKCVEMANRLKDEAERAPW